MSLHKACAIFMLLGESRGKPLVHEKVCAVLELQTAYGK